MAAGAPSITSANVATSTTAANAVAASPRRRSVTIKNIDSSITVYVGPTGVTTSNGMPLLAGESITLDTNGVVQVIAASGTPAIRVIEVSD